MSSHKTLLAGVFLALLAACTPDGPGSSGDSTFSGPRSADVREPADLRDEPELGQDWFLDSASDRSDRGGSAAASEDPYWSILLATFADPGHPRAARTFINSASSFDPRLSKAHVHSDEKGSRVLYGKYEDLGEPAAQEDLSWIKSIRSNRPPQRPVFPTPMLVRIKPDTPDAALRPIDLMSLRRRYPNVDPLMTLQVAVWGGERWERTRRQAEAYTRELRTRGFPSYVHHDEDKELSIVTVGAFDHTAIDPQSGFESSELAALRKHFPAHLVNGEPIQERLSKVTKEYRTQIPRLVEVPKQ